MEYHEVKGIFLEDWGEGGNFEVETTASDWSLIRKPDIRVACIKNLHALNLDASIFHQDVSSSFYQLDRLVFHA